MEGLPVNPYPEGDPSVIGGREKPQVPLNPFHPQTPLNPSNPYIPLNPQRPEYDHTINGQPTNGNGNTVPKPDYGKKTSRIDCS